MQKSFTFIAFLAGLLCGIWAIGIYKENWIYKIPAQYLTFSQPRGTQAAGKVINGETPKGGKSIYIFGGSASYHIANEHRLTDLMTARMGYPVHVFIIGSESQQMSDSYGLIGALSKNNRPQDTYLVFTWSAYRIGENPYEGLLTGLKQRRVLFDNVALKELLIKDKPLERNLLPIPEGMPATGPDLLAYIDKNYTSAHLSYWIKYFIYDKFLKIKAPRWIDLFKDDPIFPKGEEYSQADMDNLIKVFQTPETEQSVARNHKLYVDDFVRILKDLKATNDLDRTRDYSLYMTEKSSLLAKERGFHFAALQLPLHADMYKIPIVTKFRKDFKNGLDQLAARESFPSYVLDRPLPDMAPRYAWWDAGHATPYGAKIFEPLLLDMLEDFLKGGKGGDYGRY
ncbi:MAG TPA: hypothetical protein VIN59_07920 [Alphaproteobacteria bacterium]